MDKRPDLGIFSIMVGANNQQPASADRICMYSGYPRYVDQGDESGDDRQTIFRNRSICADLILERQQE